MRSISDIRMAEYHIASAMGQIYSSSSFNWKGPFSPFPVYMKTYTLCDFMIMPYSPFAIQYNSDCANVASNKAKAQSCAAIAGLAIIVRTDNESPLAHLAKCQLFLPPELQQRSARTLKAQWEGEVFQKIACNKVGCLSVACECDFYLLIINDKSVRPSTLSVCFYVCAYLVCLSVCLSHCLFCPVLSTCLYSSSPCLCLSICAGLSIFLCAPSKKFERMCKLGRRRPSEWHFCLCFWCCWWSWWAAAAFPFFPWPLWPLASATPLGWQPNRAYVCVCAYLSHSISILSISLSMSLSVHLYLFCPSVCLSGDYCARTGVSRTGVPRTGV